MAPGGNFDVVYLAEPDVSVSVARTVVPFRYLILPVGVPGGYVDGGRLVTGCPSLEGFSDELKVVVVAIVPVPDKLTV